MKKLFYHRFFATFLLLAVCSISWAYDFAADGIYYNINEDGNGVSVTYMTTSGSYAGSVTIPSSVSYNGKQYSVTSIGKSAFSGCSGLTSVTISESVTSIGSYAFYNCSKLTSITIPNSLTSISDYAFYSCSRLTSITIPYSLTSIGNYAFYKCSGLTSITIPESVTSIGGSAFNNCSKLTSITIPNSLTSIGDYAFNNCYRLTSVTINSNTIVSKTYPSNSNLGTIFGSQVTEYIIGNDITSIGSYAFYNCSKLTSITIPNSVTRIGSHTFDGTEWYNNQPDGLVYAGKVAYKYKGTMPEGTEIIITDGTLGIGISAFNGCTGLTAVTIPSSVINIDENAFYNCSGLTSITIPESVTSIGGSAFNGCTALTSITIPNSVTSIGNSAFYNCYGLTSITIPSSVASIGYSAFYGTGWFNNQPDGLVYAGKVAYKYKGTIPEGIEISVKIKEGTSGIAAFAFSGCTGLTSITIPNSVTSIGERAFSGCTGLTSITIPNSVTSIGSSAFNDCYGLRSVHINDIAAWCNISFKENNYDTHHRANPLVYAHHLFLNGQEVKDLVIPNTVISIGYDAFNGCTGLTSVTIPNSITNIGENAFNVCTGLTSVTIPNSMTGIGYQTFYGCSGLTSVTIPNNVTNIGSEAFSGCSGLTSITIPNNVTNIGKSAFAGCPLQTIVNHGNKEFGEDNFSDRVYLHTQLYVPEGTVWDYIFNTGWGEFHHIKEFAANADNIRNDAVYMIADRSGRNFPVFDKVTKKLKNVAYTLNIDDNDTGACWQVIEKGRGTYLYNIGAGMYAAYDKDNNLSLSIVPSAVNIDVTEDGATINGKPVMLVANKSVLPIRPTVLGDANDNDEVEIGDITSVLTLMANPDATGYNNKAADANKSGAIEIGDITTILTIMAGGE